MSGLIVPTNIKESFNYHTIKLNLVVTLISGMSDSLSRYIIDATHTQSLSPEYATNFRIDHPAMNNQIRKLILSWIQIYNVLYVATYPEQQLDLQTVYTIPTIPDMIEFFLSPKCTINYLEILLIMVRRGYDPNELIRLRQIIASHNTPEMVLEFNNIIGG